MKFSVIFLAFFITTFSGCVERSTSYHYLKYQKDSLSQLSLEYQYKYSLLQTANLSPNPCQPHILLTNPAGEQNLEPSIPDPSTSDKDKPEIVYPAESIVSSDYNLNFMNKLKGDYIGFIKAESERYLLKLHYPGAGNQFSCELVDFPYYKKGKLSLNVFVVNNTINNEYLGTGYIRIINDTLVTFDSKKSNSIDWHFEKH